MRLIPVVHVEAAADAPPDLTATQVNAIVAAVQRQADTAAAGAGLLQLDFEAPLRERNSYRCLKLAAVGALFLTARDQRGLGHAGDGLLAVLSGANGRETAEKLIRIVKRGIAERESLDAVPGDRKAASRGS